MKPRNWHRALFPALDALRGLTRGRARRAPGGDARRTKLELVALEERLVPDGRPLPLPIIYAGSGVGESALVRSYDAETGAERFSVSPFTAGYRGGVAVGTADLNLDGIPEVFAAPASAGTAPVVKAFDGRTGAAFAGPLAEFRPFERLRAGGLAVAGADVNRDGVPDVIVAAVTPDGARVRAFSGRDGAVVADFGVTGWKFGAGLTVAAADLTGDGRAEVLVGAAVGGVARVYDPRTGQMLTGPLGEFKPFGASYTGGVNIGADSLAGDVDGDGVNDIAVVNQVQRAFNGLGQLVTEYQEHGGAVNTSTSPKVQYAWSEMASGANHSRLTSITYASGYVLTYNYASGLNSNVSRLTSLSDANGTLESYDHLGFGTVVRRGHAQPNVDLSFIKRSGESNTDAGDQYTGLDRFGRVVDQRWMDATSGTSKDRLGYTYDAMGNRTARTNAVNSSFDETYTYDGLNQLLSFARGSDAQSYDFDAVGNWESVTTNGTTQTRGHNKQNEITSVSGATTPTFDANGNMTGDETGRQFVYDAWNRMVEVKNSGGTALKTYKYDALNRRISETASGTTRDLYYSAQWQVLEERVSGNTERRYVWSPVYVDALVLRDRDTDANGSLDERLYVIQDANFNVTALVDTSGNVVERYTYTPFGVQTVYDASWTVRTGGSSYSFTHGFQGMSFDSVAGLNPQRYRWYSPTLGRWVTMDPIRYRAGDVNLYGFVGNQPTRFTDPAGTKKSDPVEVKLDGDLTIYYRYLEVEENKVKLFTGWDKHTRLYMTQGLQLAYKMAVKARDHLNHYSNAHCNKLHDKRNIPAHPVSDPVVSKLLQRIYGINGNDPASCKCIAQILGYFNNIIDAFKNAAKNPIEVGMFPDATLNGIFNGQVNLGNKQGGPWAMIVLGAAYWDGKSATQDDFAGAILHEMSHAFAGTLDHSSSTSNLNGRRVPPDYYFRPADKANPDRWEALFPSGLAQDATPNMNIRCENASAVQYFAQLLYPQV